MNPEYTFGLKLSSIYSAGIGSGPGNYAVKYGLKAKGFDDGLSYTMRPKAGGEIGQHNSPGPIYNPSLVHNETSNLSSPTSQHSGPNVYKPPPMMGPKVETRISAPECTLKGGWKQKPAVMNPGPIYDVGRPELIKEKVPGFTMRIKWPEIKSQTGNAGPGSYDVDKVYSKPRPAWHFGTKYSDFAGVFRTEYDKLRFDCSED